MPIKLKIAANCLASAILSVGALWAMMSLAFYMNRNGMNALVALAEFFDQENVRLAAFIYDIFRFLVFGSIAAVLMLFMKPRHVLLYSLASILLLAPLLQFLRFGSDFFSVALSITWTLTIPLLYWWFVRLEEERHNKSLNTGTGDAGSG